jgi:tight adherence protein B
MNILVPAIVIFIGSVLILELLFYSFRAIRHPDRSKIKEKLRKIRSQRREEDLPDLTRKRVMSDVPLLNQILLRITLLERLDRLVHLAHSQYPPGFYILLALLFAGSASLVLYHFMGVYILLTIGIAIVFGSLPFLYLVYMKNRRMNKFQAQLPESLDLMARSLRAGHAFSTGMKLAADEFDDPLGTEFEITLDEINFGLGVPDALKNMLKRVDCVDLNFFVIAVILQRETGGNLAEVMENIAYLIRERYKIYGQIQTLAAEGKLSMYVLLALPFFVFGGIFFANPEYIMMLVREPAGKIMCVIALIMMAIGAYVMKKMVDIEV